MDNKEFLEPLKFGVGDGNLQYYLYNWKCPEISSNKVIIQCFVYFVYLNLVYIIDWIDSSITTRKDNKMQMSMCTMYE